MRNSIELRKLLIQIDVGIQVRANNSCDGNKLESG